MVKDGRKQTTAGFHAQTTPANDGQKQKQTKKTKKKTATGTRPFFRLEATSATKPDVWSDHLSQPRENHTHTTRTHSTRVESTHENETQDQIETHQASPSQCHTEGDPTAHVPSNETTETTPQHACRQANNTQHTHPAKQQNPCPITENKSAAKSKDNASPPA